VDDNARDQSCGFFAPLFDRGAVEMQVESGCILIDLVDVDFRLVIVRRHDVEAERSFLITQAASPMGLQQGDELFSMAGNGFDCSKYYEF